MARESAGRDMFSSLSPENTMFVPEEERLSQAPEMPRPSLPPEGREAETRPRRFEAPVLDGDDQGVQAFADPEDGAMFFAMVKGEDPKAARETAAVLRNACGEGHLGATAGRGRLEATSGVRTVAGEHGQIVNPREDFADLATASAARYGLELTAAENKANEFRGRPALDVAVMDGLIYDQRVDPKDFYGVDLDPSNQARATIEGEGGAALLAPLTKELNLIAVMKPADASPEAAAARDKAQGDRLMRMVGMLEANAGFRSLNPDARLNLTEAIKSKIAAKGISLSDGVRESIDRLREHELDKDGEAAVGELFTAITRFGKDAKTGERRKLTMREIRFGMKDAPDLSPNGRVTLYDRLLRNGYIEKGTPEAEAILTERRVQVATTGDARVYAVTPDLQVRDVTAESEAAGKAREVPIGADPSAPEMKRIVTGNFHAEPGTTIVVTRQGIAAEDLSRRFQIQPDNLVGIREELDRDSGSQTVIFKVK